MNFSLPTPPLPGKPTLTSPTGTISTKTPTYQWQAQTGVTWYYLWVDSSSSNVLKQWYTPEQAGCASGTGTCSVTPSVNLSAGSYAWAIQAWNGAGSSPWSDPMRFSPSVPVGASPLTPNSSVTNPVTYTWNAVSGTTWYYLWLDGPSGNVLKKWYTPAQAGCANGTGICSVTPSITLSSGKYAWAIQAWNDIGSGPWSPATYFSVP